MQFLSESLSVLIKAYGPEARFTDIVSLAFGAKDKHIRAKEHAEPVSIPASTIDTPHLMSKSVLSMPTENALNSMTRFRRKESPVLDPAIFDAQGLQPRAIQKRARL